MSEVIAIRLDDGSVIHADVDVRGEENVAFTSASFDFESVAATIRGVAGSVRRAIEPLLPDKTSVEFGLELAIENGGLAAIVAKGSAKANFTISLEWSRPQASAGG
ncbi:MAG TPA: CU044_2847 family protein [Thermoanaerobaculia bacterium]|nr:CU044_2847 family protein [Thermoanaerobaculia bacterium]